jgi:hypothetical protein
MPGRTQLVHTSLAVAPGAEQLEVGEIVAAAVAERDAMVDVEASGGAAANADTIASMNLRPELAPRPAALDAASRSPVVALRRASRATAAVPG